MTLLGTWTGLPLVTLVVLGFGCGTTPGIEAGDQPDTPSTDDGGNGDVGDVGADNDPQPADAPIDAAVDGRDDEHGSDGLDAPDPPDLDVLDDPAVQQCPAVLCEASDGVVHEGGVVVDVVPGQSFECSTSPRTRGEWTYRDQDTDQEGTYTTGADRIRFSCLRPLVSTTLSFSSEGCVVGGPWFSCPPPPQPDGPGATDYVELTWFTESDPQRLDLDLHVLQSPEICWGDRYRDLHHRSPGGALDWGEIGDGGDIVHFGLDVVNANELPESAWWESVADGHTYVVGVHARTNRRATARIRVIRGDAVELDVVRDVTGPAWWTVAEVSGDAITPVDRVDLVEPSCALRECGGRVESPEICNGLDDDCDGAVDESPEACYHSIGIHWATCTWVTALAEFVCLDL